MFRPAVKGEPSTPTQQNIYEQDSLNHIEHRKYQEAAKEDSKTLTTKTSNIFSNKEENLISHFMRNVPAISVTYRLRSQNKP